jgi:hypothetical protein
MEETMRNWQREIEIQMYRDSQKPCSCENNGDLCVSCEALDYIQHQQAIARRRDLSTRVSRVFQDKHGCTQSFSDWKVTEMTASELQDVLDRQKDVTYNRISGGL